jgi:phage baseplate assembly protein W
MNQLDWAKSPLTYRFEIVAMDAQTMQSALNIVGKIGAGSPHGCEPGAGIVARVDLAINPQRYSVDEPTRQNVTQTVAGAWVDAYGLGLPQISLSGTTGWNPRRKKASSAVNLATINAAQAALPTLGQTPSPTGLRDFVILRNNIFRLYAVLLTKLKLNSLKSVQASLQLRFYAWDTQDYFIVLINDFKLDRNSMRPTMYDYSMPMTVIGYIDGANALFDALAQFNNPLSRLQSILNSINNFVSTAEAVESAVQNFEASVANSIASVATDLTTIATAIQTGITGIVSGAEGIINAPFALVNTCALALRNIASSVVAIEQLPQEFVNDVRAQIMETLCAVTALATYPTLFAQAATVSTGDAPWGNAGCSSTMGVPPSPLSAAAGVSIPGVLPTSTQLPTDITFPTVPLALSATANPNPTVASRPKQVVIQEGDTIESIIAKNGGLDPSVASVWQQIATMNGLEYPYIAPNSEFNPNVYATGAVVFYGTPGSVVPIGTRVAYTPPSGTPIYFDTNAAVTLGSNGQGSVTVTAEAPGALANVVPQSINQILDALGNPLSIAGITSVSNASQTSGGRIWQVLMPGDTLLLPVAANVNGQEPYLNRTPDNDQNLFGIDILLDETGDFVSDATGDLATVGGLDNMEVAVINRLTTEPTELIKHPGYGLHLVRIVGQPGDLNTATLMKLEMKATLLQDPRITGVSGVKVSISTADQELIVNANIALINEQTAPLATTVPI